MKNKTREVIYEEMIKGQHHVLVLMHDGYKDSHYEYYVGIPKEHPYHISNPIPGRGIKSDGKNRWFNEPPINKQGDLYKISQSIAFNNTRDLRRAIKSMKEPFRINNVSNFDFDKVIALEHAWLSFQGNLYEFLKEEYCYYGGGMYIPTFGKNSCKNSAEIALKLLGNHFLQVRDIIPKHLNMKVKFEGTKESN
jgi:hypothetical protein